MHSVIQRVRSLLQKSALPFRKKKVLFYSVLVLILLFTEILLSFTGMHRLHKSPDVHAQLQALSDRIFLYELSGDSLSLHYTLSEPDSYHIALYDSIQRSGDSSIQSAGDGTYYDYLDNFLTAVSLPGEAALPAPALSALSYDRISLPSYSAEQTAQAQQDYDAFLNSLSHLDTSQLSKHDRWYWQTLYSSLSRTRDILTYEYYYEPLSPSSGEQTNLLILLAEYAIEEQEDIVHYLDTLACVDEYFDSLLLYEQEKSAAGLFMSDTAADKVISQCDSLVKTSELASGTHFLQTTFVSRLQNLLAKSLITTEEYTTYCEKNNQILTTIVAPAYEKLSDGLYLLMGTGKDETGLCHDPQGAKYYTALLRQQTGSGRTPEELLTLFTEQFTTDFEALQVTARQLAAEDLQSVITLPYATPEEMLTDLQSRMSGDFPAFTEISDQSPGSSDVTGTEGPFPALLPSCTVKPVASCLSAYVSPAYYMIPTLDTPDQNSIYINYGDQPDSLTLYTTLAHEGYPGHLYQTTYHLTQLSDPSAFLPLEGILSISGYVEGWATYVEDLSYEYAKEAICTDASIPNSDTLCSLCDFYRLDRRLQLCLYSILDVSIHYYGMTQEESGAFLGSFGIADPASQQSIYEYLVEEPGNYLRYYLGYLEIQELRKTAQKLWGNTYTDLRFHTFYLQNGPAPFSMLQELLLSSGYPISGS